MLYSAMNLELLIIMWWKPPTSRQYAAEPRHIPSVKPHKREQFNSSNNTCSVIFYVIYHPTIMCIDSCWFHQRVKNESNYVKCFM